MSNAHDSASHASLSTIRSAIGRVLTCRRRDALEAEGVPVTAIPGDAEADTATTPPIGQVDRFRASFVLEASQWTTAGAGSATHEPQPGDQLQDQGVTWEVSASGGGPVWRWVDAAQRWRRVFVHQVPTTGGE